MSSLNRPLSPKEERQAQALRENLLKRKVWQRSKREKIAEETLDSVATSLDNGDPESCNATLRKY